MKWISPDELNIKSMQASLEEVLNGEATQNAMNPYWENWGRGRPSKEKKAKREKYYEWERIMDELFPSRKPFLNMLKKMPQELTSLREGGVKVLYTQRTTG